MVKKILKQKKPIPISKPASKPVPSKIPSHLYTHPLAPHYDRGEVLPTDRLRPEHYGPQIYQKVRRTNLD
tara:strand:+ start:1154 stop:1363 length:210 start_codon:yes stop_codon:yes gene_type:complete